MTQATACSSARQVPVPVSTFRLDRSLWPRAQSPKRCPTKRTLGSTWAAWQVSNSVSKSRTALRGLKNVKGLLILPNRHPHGDPKGDGWLEFYQMLSPAMQLPYMIYHVQPGITIQQYVQLARDPNFVELKWALATPEALDHLRQAVRVLSASVSVVCGLGDKNGPDWIREYGVRGWTSYTVNHAPRLCKEIELASLAGDTARVQALQGPVLAFEDQRFGDNVRFNNRLVVAALQGREAFLRPPNRRYDDAEWREAEAVITRLGKAEAESHSRSSREAPVSG